MCLWLNWIEHLTTDQKVGGSSPSRHATYSNYKAKITAILLQPEKTTSRQLVV